jgi:hypothetical protein
MLDAIVCIIARKAHHHQIFGVQYQVASRMRNLTQSTHPE